MHVQVGHVLAGVTRTSFNNNVNPVYRASIRLDSGQVVQAFVKNLSQKELANEVLAAAIGRKLGLPIPAPVLAVCRDDLIEGGKTPFSNEGMCLMFASAAVNAGPILQIVSGRYLLPSELLAQVVSWDHLGQLYGFDSWIANVDRHPGNLLLTGGGDVWLIDHGHSFTGPDWQSGTLSPCNNFPSRLKSWLTPAIPMVRRNEVLSHAIMLPHDLTLDDLKELAAECYLDQILSKEDREEMVAFLSARIPHVQEECKSALELLI